MITLLTMTGPAIYDLMDQLRLRSEEMSREWRNAIDEPLEMRAVNAEKWAKIAEIFKDAKSRICDAARGELLMLKALMEEFPVDKAKDHQSEQR